MGKIKELSKDVKTVDLHEASAEAWWESDNFWYDYLEMTKI